MKQIEASGILNKVELWNLHCKSTLQERMLENQKPCTQSCMKVKFKKKKRVEPNLLWKLAVWTHVNMSRKNG